MKQFLFGLCVWGVFSFHGGEAAAAEPVLIKANKTVFEGQAQMRDLISSNFVNFRPGMREADCLIKLYRELTAFNVTLGDVVRSITVLDLYYDDGSVWRGMSIVFENPQMKHIETLGKNALCPTNLTRENPFSAKFGLK